MPESKKTQRNVRISVELERDIQAMAESLHEVGLLPEPNWSAALVMVLMQAKTAGLLDTPPQVVSATGASGSKQVCAPI